MAGTLTLGGMADGTAAGNLDFGPNTVNGLRIIGKVVEVKLEANVDFTITVPSEAVQWAAFFNTAASAPEVKVGSNLIATTSGMPVSAKGHLSVPVAAGMTELKLKAASPPEPFNVVFV